jgi:hypothetical protein
MIYYTYATQDALPSMQNNRGTPDEGGDKQKISNTILSMSALQCRKPEEVYANPGGKSCSQEEQNKDHRKISREIQGSLSSKLRRKVRTNFEITSLRSMWHRWTHRRTPHGLYETFRGDLAMSWLPFRLSQRKITLGE